MAYCDSCRKEKCDAWWRHVCPCECHGADFLNELVLERSAKSREFPKHLRAALEKLQPPLKCVKHPKYQGKRRPRAVCETCHHIWEKNQR